jgi:hypothetical protein
MTLKLDCRWGAPSRWVTVVGFMVSGCGSDAAVNDCACAADDALCQSDGSCAAAVPVARWAITGNDPDLPVTSTVGDVTAVELGRASTFTVPPDLSYTFATRDWPLDSETVDTAKFFEFGVAAGEGRSVTYDRIEFAVSCGFCTDASANWQLRSSVDDFDGVLAEGSLASIVPPASVSPSVRSIATRSGMVTFRLYFYNVTRSANSRESDFPYVGLQGSDGGGADLSIFGIVEP